MISVYKQTKHLNNFIQNCRNHTPTLPSQCYQDHHTTPIHFRTNHPDAGSRCFHPKLFTNYRLYCFELTSFWQATLASEHNPIKFCLSYKRFNDVRRTMSLDTVQTILSLSNNDVSPLNIVSLVTCWQKKCCLYTNKRRVSCIKWRRVIVRAASRYIISDSALLS